MAVSLEKLLVYRITHKDNLGYILANGIYYRNSIKVDPNYINIGSNEIISRRDSIGVPVASGGCVNDYIPFYFGMRSPMLLKIVTGHGVPKVEPHNIIYLCCEVTELIKYDSWCFTDGNAATTLTRFYSSTENLSDLDWKSIYATDWKNGADGDPDRMRKKQAEFLVNGYVSQHDICKIIVHNQKAKTEIEKIVQYRGLNKIVEVDPNGQYYY